MARSSFAVGRMNLEHGRPRSPFLMNRLQPAHQRRAAARLEPFLALPFSPTMAGMNLRIIGVALLVLGAALSMTAEDLPSPSARNARILLVPRRMISGDRVTLAVLDVNGRLTPGATIAFSNGDRVTTDSTGRAAFVAPLSAGVLYVTIQGRAGRVQTLILPARAEKSAAQAMQGPHFASLSDRFELQGHGFCGEADRNVVQVNGRPALVLASSSESMIALPPEDLEAGPADVTVTCNKAPASAARVVFLSLSLEADRSPLQPGQQRTLSVRVVGSQERVTLEARNLAPDIAELAGGNPARAVSSGGAENIARFPLTGKQRGNILVSIRLVPAAVRGKP
jgi:hypothetical protein